MLEAAGEAGRDRVDDVRELVPAVLAAPEPLAAVVVLRRHVITARERWGLERAPDGWRWEACSSAKSLSFV